MILLILLIGNDIIVHENEINEIKIGTKYTMEIPWWVNWWSILVTMPTWGGLLLRYYLFADWCKKKDKII